MSNPTTTTIAESIPEKRKSEESSAKFFAREEKPTARDLASLIITILFSL